MQAEFFLKAYSSVGTTVLLTETASLQKSWRAEEDSHQRFQRKSCFVQSQCLKDVERVSPITLPSLSGLQTYGRQHSFPPRNGGAP
jgi:hypothetical protein